MDFRKWQEEQRESKKEEYDNLPPEKFFGRKDELAQLKAFMEEDTKKVFFLYGVPMIGKSTLVREFSRSIPEYKQVTIKFNNPENPETTLEKQLPEINLQENNKLFIVIENFEEALLWKGDQQHLHEVKFPKVKQFILDVSKQLSIKLLLESRFQIKNDILPVDNVAELYSKQLGKIDRKELFDALNEIYRQHKVQYNSFEEVCDKLNDHVWLIELAMQNEWLYEDIREAIQHPESLTQKLWEKVQIIIRKLPQQHRTLLCAFGLINPLSETDIKTNLGTLPAFAKKDELNNALHSLRKKLLLVYEAEKQLYELNSFLREVCFTYLQGQKEMKAIEQLPLFKAVQLPKYDSVLQAHAKGDYATFFRIIKEKRKKGEYDAVVDILKEVYWTDSKPAFILNEIGVTYKWKRDYPKAIEYLEKACELGNIHSYNELAIVYKEQKNYPKAIEYLEKACALGNIHSYNELAIVYKEQKDYAKAIETLEKALKEEPTDVWMLNELGIVYKEQKNYPKAIETLGKALKEQPKNAKVLNELGIVYKEQKNYPKAIETLERASREDPADVMVLNELATVYKEIGDFEKALNTVNKGLDAKPNDYVLRTTLNRIIKEKSSKENPTSKKSSKENATSKKRGEEKHTRKTSADKQRILFIAANPSNLSRLQTDSEYRIIKAEIKRGTHRDAFEFLQPQLAVTITELLRAMNEKPQIIHFSGHGDTSGIVISTEDNQSRVLPIAAMERLFKPLKNVTRVVILNSCYSSDQAKAISEYGMYVVGNNLPIGDKAAIGFAKGLYNGFSEGKEFESAFNDAMVIVLTESPQYSNVIEVWKDGVKLSL